MSNIIPPLLSTTPPPIVDNFDEDEDDEFGDYRTAGETSFACNSPSVPPTPDYSPKKTCAPSLDVNKNNRNESPNQLSVDILARDKSNKDFQDRRKSLECLEKPGSFPPFCDTPTESPTNYEVEVEKEIIYENSCDAPRVDGSVDLPIKAKNKYINGYEDCSLSEVNRSPTVSEVTNESADNCSDDIPSDTTHSEITEDNKLNEPFSKVNPSIENGANSIDSHQIEDNDSEKGVLSSVVENHLSGDDLSTNSTHHTLECQSNKHKFADFSEFSSAKLDSLIPQTRLTITDSVSGENLEVPIEASAQVNLCIVPKTNESPSITLKGIEIVDPTEKAASITSIPCGTVTEDEDDFGDFHCEVKCNSKEDNVSVPDISVRTEDNCDPDLQINVGCDSTSSETVNQSVETNVSCNAENNTQAIDDSNDDFDDFVACTDIASPNIEIQPFQSANSNEIDEDFGNFADFSSAEVLNNETHDDDEFGDFESQLAVASESASEEDVMLDVNCKDVFDRAEKIIKMMFEPVISETLTKLNYTGLTESDNIFGHIKDITETKALSYQWAKSSSQKSLLKALKIDETEVLYGPSWNLSLPRFAANLSTAPLEPVRSDVLNSTNAVPSNLPNFSPTNVDVPTAQFDWSSSGLTNPLDYSQTMLLDLEHLVQTLDISGSLHTVNSIEPVSATVDELEEWDLWLKSKAAKEKSEHSRDNEQSLVTKEVCLGPVSQGEKIDYVASILSPSVLEPEVLTFSSTKPDFTGENLSENQLSEFDSSVNEQTSNTCDDFEFTAFQSSCEQNWSVPLRETHISEPNKCPVEVDVAGWLQPTILTPVLPRKNDLQEDDEFDDFQMVPPVLVPYEEKNEKLVTHSSTDSSCKQSHENIKEGQFSKTDEISKQDLQVKAADISSEVTSLGDDEFTDFYSSLPVNNVKSSDNTLSSAQNLDVLAVNKSKIQSLLEPLQPVPLEPIKPISVQLSSSTQINWPNPGITDEDLSNINLSYSIKTTDVKVEKRVDLTPKRLQEVKGEQLIDEDDWSDFVSVQDTHKSIASSNKPERTSTPDLPLSVLNLGQVQPVKQPIPVITPKGLIQTQLPSSVPPLKVVQTSIANSSTNNMQHLNIRPSLITDQFIGQMYHNNPAEFCASGGSFINSLPNTNLPVDNSLHKVQHSVNPLRQTADDDDYWSDFVSSKPVQQPSTSIQPPKVRSNFSKPIHHLNGLYQNITPNIITNPSHFDAFQSYVPPSDITRHSKANNHSRRSTLSSISAIPDLDFVAPKSRVANRK